MKDHDHPKIWPVTFPPYFIYILGASLITILVLLSLPYLSYFDGTQGNDWAIAFGRLHIVVLHLPIGWLTIIPLLEFCSKKFALQGIDAAIRIVLFGAALSAILAVAFGFTLASTDGYSGSTVNRHMWFGIITSVATILACLHNELYRLIHVKLLRWGYLASLTIALFAITVGGHLGGALVQGEGYLTEKLPSSLKVYLGIEKAKVMASMDSSIYPSFIAPLLDQKCVECHSKKKIKGKFRIDTTEHLFNDGRSKLSAIIPGDAKESELIRRISLPHDHDDIMPPKGRTPLTEQQITLLRWWVNVGAPINESINHLSSDQLTAEVEPILEQRINESQRGQAPLENYENLEEQTLHSHIQHLRSEFGIEVAPISQDPIDGLHVSVFNSHKPFNEQAWLTLTELTKFIYSMDLSSMTLTRNDMAKIAQFTQLHTLKLNNAKIEGNTLLALSPLTKLKSLNLFNTAIGDTSLDAIKGLKSIRTLYLAQTQFSQPGIQSIKTSHHHVKIFGGITQIQTPENEEPLSAP